MSLSSLLSEVQPTLCSVCTPNTSKEYLPCSYSHLLSPLMAKLLQSINRLQKVICSRVAMARCLFKSQVTWQTAVSLKKEGTKEASETAHECRPHGEASMWKDGGLSELVEEADQTRVSHSWWTQVRESLSDGVNAGSRISLQPSAVLADR